MELRDSKTRENLMRAFAGESQARNRYTFAAELAMENDLYVIKKVFDLTAEQEKEHADVFYGFLKEVEGENIEIEKAGYPVNTSDDLKKQLMDAVHNETEESDSVYRQFGDTALEEGFHQIAGKFYMIAEIEKNHARRFQEFYDLLKEDRLFVETVQTGWMCLKCGNIIETTTAPQNCPVCDSSQGYFVRVSMSPMNVPGMGENKEQNLGH